MWSPLCYQLFFSPRRIMKPIQSDSKYDGIDTSLLTRRSRTLKIRQRRIPTKLMMSASGQSPFIEVDFSRRLPVSSYFGQSAQKLCGLLIILFFNAAAGCIITEARKNIPACIRQSSVVAWRLLDVHVYFVPRRSP